MSEQTTPQAKTPKAAAPRHRTSSPQKRGKNWRIQWIDHTGERRSASFPTRERASQELERVKGMSRFVRDGALPLPPEPITFQEFAEQYYLPNRTALSRRPRNDLSILKNHLQPYFGEMNLTDISTREIETFKSLKMNPQAFKGNSPRSLQARKEIERQAKNKKMSALNLNHILALLRSTMNYAHQNGFINFPPIVKLLRVTEEPMKFIKTQGEVQRFLLAAMEEEDGTFELFATAVYTGMRQGELLALRKEDVDLERRLICVSKSYDQPTKSGRVRYIPILDALHPILAAWMLRNPHPWVFPNEVGKMHTPVPRVCKTVFKRCLAKAGLPAMRFHDLRHTFASQWMINGGRIEKLQKILGHTTLTMTLRYSHLTPDVFTEDRNIFKTSGQLARDAAPNVVTLQRASGENA